MTKFAIATLIGTDISSRTIASRLRREIVRAVAAGCVELDFSGVRTISDSFADELLGVLARDNGEEWFRDKIKVVNLAESLRESVLAAISNRLCGPAH